MRVKGGNIFKEHAAHLVFVMLSCSQLPLLRSTHDSFTLADSHLLATAACMQRVVYGSVCKQVLPEEFHTYYFFYAFLLSRVLKLYYVPLLDRPDSYS